MISSTEYINSFSYQTPTTAYYAYEPNRTGSILDLKNLFKISATGNNPLIIESIYTANTPSDNLNDIKDTLKPSIGDLARVFGVSRQMIHKWLNGETISDIHTTTLDDLKEASLFLASNIHGDVSLLAKRKITNGKNIFELVKDKECTACEAAHHLLKIVHIENDQRLFLQHKLGAYSPTNENEDLGIPLLQG